jgi:type I restriction enzyme S subunit
MNDWKPMRAADFIDFNPRENIPSGTMAKKVAMEQLQPFTMNISSYEIALFNGGSKFRNGDTLMARITPCLENGKTAQVNILEENEVGFGSTEFIVLRAKPGISDKDFIYYLAISPLLRDKAIKSMVGSSGRQRVQQGVLNDIEFFAPPLEEQIEIGRILRVMDDKISNNKAENHHLEQMAQAIFKSWFVDFEPWGGVMPEDWVSGRVEDFFDISIGKTPPRKEPKWFTANPSDVIWVSISDMSNCGVFVSDSSEYLTAESVERFNVKVVPSGTVLLSFKLTVGRVAITDGEMTTNEAIAHFKCLDNIVTEYLYCYLKMFDYQILGNTSSIATAVNSKTVKSMPFVMPDKKVLQKFHAATTPMFEQIRVNLEESARLATLRDTLLPRLMSGELSPKNY